MVTYTLPDSSDWDGSWTALKVHWERLSGVKSLYLQVLRDLLASNPSKATQMGETKKIDIEHFPVEKLPDELRRGIESGQLVRVTVESDIQEETSARQPLRSFFGAGKGCYTEQEAVSFIRQLRDE